MDITRWEKLRNFDEMNDEEKAKVVSDNFEELFSLLSEEYPELTEVTVFLAKSAEQMGFDNLSFYADHKGRFGIRSCYLSYNYQKQFDKLEKLLGMDSAIENAKEFFNWVSNFHKEEPNLEFFYLEDNDEIYVNSTEGIADSRSLTAKELRDRLILLKKCFKNTVHYNHLKSVELKAVFCPEKSYDDINALTEKIVSEKEILLAPLTQIITGEIENTQNEIERKLTCLEFPKKLKEWFDRNPEFVFSESGDMCYLDSPF